MLPQQGPCARKSLIDYADIALSDRRNPASLSTESDSLTNAFCVLAELFVTPLSLVHHLALLIRVVHQMLFLLY